MNAFILNTVTGKIFKELPSIKVAEDTLEALDYQAPRISHLFDIYVMGENGWACPDATLPKMARRLVAKMAA